MARRLASAGRRAAVVLALAAAAATARPVQHWTLKKLAHDNDVLVVGEVLGTATVRAVPREQSRWQCALLEKAAKVRVLRTQPRRLAARLTPNEVLSIRYWALDLTKPVAIVNGPEFPEFHKGEVWVLPLRSVDGKGPERLALLGDEDFGLLVPAAAERLPEAGIEMDVEFLRAELAGAFARGRYADIVRAGTYLSRVYDAGEVAAVSRLVARHVGEHEARWLDIAVAAYCAMPMPRSKLAELLADGKRRRPAESLVALALARVRPEGRDARIIATAIDHVSLHAWGTAVTLADNYRRHPLTVTRLGQALAADAPDAVYVAAMLVRDREHPLLAAALPAARRRARLRERSQPGNWRGFNTLRAACELLRDYGSDEDFAALLDELRRAQTGDRERFMRLFQSVAYAKTRRLLPVCRLAIDDTGVLSGKTRFCDVAAFEAQHLSGVDFGVAAEQSRGERAKAIARVSAWLAEHAR